MLKQRLMYIFMLLADIGVFIFTNTRPLLISAIVMIILPIMSFAVLLITVSTMKTECEIDSITETNTEIFANLKINSKINVYPGMISFRRVIHSVMFDVKDENIFEYELANRKKIINIKFKTPMCGRHNFIIDNVKFYDALRLFGISKNFSIEKSITVYPKCIDMTVLRKNASTIENDGIIYDKYKKGNDRSEIFDLRDYEKGDDRRSIHWKLSSKVNKTIVREFSRPNNFKTMILCDLSLKFDDKEISYDVVSNNIALALAISSDMTKNGVEHSMCMLGKNVSEIAEINGIQDDKKIQNGILSVPLSKREFNTALYFLNINSSYKVSKLIYITREYDKESIRMLSNIMNVTIIVTNDDDNNTYELDNNTEIVSLSTKKLYETSHHISV